MCYVREWKHPGGRAKFFIYFIAPKCCYYGVEHTRKISDFYAENWLQNKGQKIVNIVIEIYFLFWAWLGDDVTRGAADMVV